MLVLDLEDKREAQFFDDLARDLEKNLPGTRVTVQGKGVLTLTHEAGTSTAVLIPAGLPEDKLLAALKISRFGMDDYLLKICLEESSVFSTMQKKGEFSESKEHSVCCAKLREVIEALRTQDFAPTSSKRVLQVFWGIVGFRAAPATFAEQLLNATPHDITRKVFADIGRRLETATEG